MAKPPLTVQNAAITTASVEIKTLTVSGKQVTLAVFRQLIEKPLILADGTLAGQPWGVVNYHPDKCANSSTAHWHVVWQEDTELRRSLVVVTPDFGVFRPVEAEQFIASCVHDVLSTGTTRYFRGAPPLSKWSEAGSVKLPTDHDFTTVTCLSRTGYSAIESSQALASRRERYGESSKISEWYAREIAEAEQEHATAIAALSGEVRAYGADTDELYARYAAAVDIEHQRRERHTAACESLSTLPQLFIAV
ncbi:hypothetical protein [Amycolatopsis sp. cmx-4-54]|uniref:hypothetical protein n=1 Tax=Amycolatopsis sp. cmx-4-54 TaxID=2790936 RepID=UPI00397A099A